MKILNFVRKIKHSGFAKGKLKKERSEKIT